MNKPLLGTLFLALSAAACASGPEATAEAPNADAVVGADLAGELAFGINTEQQQEYRSSFRALPPANAPPSVLTKNTQSPAWRLSAAAQTGPKNQVASRKKPAT